MRVGMILAVVVLAANVLVAQTFRGTVLGTVTDASGAVVAGARVTVRNVDTGLERSTQTSADGSYSVPELPIGTYSVTVSQTGFQTAVTTGVIVDVAGERRVELLGDSVDRPLNGREDVFENAKEAAEKIIFPVDRRQITQVAAGLSQGTTLDLPERNGFWLSEINAVRGHQSSTTSAST